VLPHPRRTRHGRDEFAIGVSDEIEGFDRFSAALRHQPVKQAEMRQHPAG